MQMLKCFYFIITGALFYRLVITVLTAVLLTACTGLPQGINPVSGFDSERYLGRWYEIARLDHSFERGLQQVTATYSKRDDGGIKVINRGFDTEDRQWQEAEGKAYFVDDNNIAHLKVSFFGPFYGSYVVFDLDGDYQWSYVTSNDRDYLWFLSRTPTISEDAKQRFIDSARKQGFDVDALIWAEQE